MRRVLLTTDQSSRFHRHCRRRGRSAARRCRAKAPAYVPVGYNWTGFYLGINGGYGWGRSRWSGFGSNADPSGGMVGGTAGYNWQALGSPWVFGLEGDIDWTNIKAASPTSPARPAARPRTTGSAPRAAASATPGTASCPTSPAALRSATSRPTKSVSPACTTPMSAGRPAAASKRRWPATGPPSSNIFTSISATSIAAPCHAAVPTNVDFHADEVRARPELPVLIAERQSRSKSPGRTVRGFCMCMELCGQYSFSVS